jgi:SAM-dependent methyltransferase
MSEHSLVEYYRKRAAQDDETYGPPEIQRDFDWVSKWLRQYVAGRRVLEIACGTGHWTAVAAQTAGWILASDITPDLVQVARRKTAGNLVDFMVADACKLPLKSDTFDCGMAHFWLSHLPRSGLFDFVNGLRQLLQSGSRMLFVDTKWVDGYRKAIARSDAGGNTYHLRTLRDGSQYEILKNYFSRDEWIAHLEPFGSVHIEELEYIWAIRVEMNPS